MEIIFCSFCGKEKKLTKHFNVSKNMNAAICNECVECIWRIMESEPPENKYKLSKYLEEGGIVNIDRNLLHIISEDIIKKYLVVPFHFKDNKLSLMISSSAHKVEVEAILKEKYNYDIIIGVMSKKGMIERTIEYYYGK